MKKSIVTIMVFILSITLLTACGEKKSEKGVVTDGSTSMEKIIGALGEVFQKDTDIGFSYNPTGSSAGIKAVQEGRCDIGLASRELKTEEKDSGLEGTVLAYDGIAIIVNKDNPIGDLSLDDIAKIYKGEITNWDQVGGESSPIVLIGREAGSGTRDGFESITGTEEQCAYRQELSSTGDVITTVSQNKGAIGYASLASIKDNVKPIKVAGVEPTEENIKNGSYLVQRPLLLVTNSQKPLSDSAQKFFDFAISAKAREVITATGMVPAN